MITICFAIDYKYINSCAVAIASILANSKSEFYFYILYYNITKKDKEKLESLNKIRPFKITFIEITSRKLKGYYLPRNSHFSCSTYFRLKIPSVLKENKAIYLDADLVVLKDIKLLWDIPFDEHYILACQSMCDEDNCERLEMSKNNKYINSGVMVMDLDKIRKDNLENKCYEYLDKHGRGLRNLDQDVINVVYSKIDKGIKLIPQNWNTEIRTDMPYKKEYLPIVNNPFIIHFLTKEKPWLKGCKQLYQDKYKQYESVAQSGN